MDPLYSSSWYRAEALRPCLGVEARFHRHVYRGEVWYVVRIPTTGRVHRLAPAAHAFAALLNGERTVHEAWELVIDRFEDAAPTQDEALQMLGVLHQSGLLHGDVPADTLALFRRAEEEERKEQRGHWNPMAFRVPLFDPELFLSRWQWLVDPVFSRVGALVWCVVVAAAGVAALAHTPELTAAARSLFEPASVLAMWFAYPVVKTVHEFGHAFAVKRWGGDVHEMGVLFLVFMPVPYVDASAASVFPDKRRRMVVGAVGIAVELFLAALATFVWLAVEPGLVRHVAYAVMLTGGISTLLFNGNPLLRFDGYHVLVDAIEIPNLGSKANQYVGALAKRHWLGLKDTPLPDTAPGEPAWLVGYAIGSFLYGIAIMLGIALYLATRFFTLGVALALYTVGVRIALPLLRQISWLVADPVAGDRRVRVLGGSLAGLVLAGLFLFALPVPLHTRSQGLVWLPEQAHVRAGVGGFVIEVLAEPHGRVRVGDPLIRMRDAALETEVQGLEAERRQIDLRVTAFSRDDRVKAEIARERLGNADAALARARERANEVLIRSQLDGMFVPPGGTDLAGRYVRQGEVVAYVVDLETATARVVVSQDDVAVVRDRTEAAWVRLAHDLPQVLPARVTRQVPAATDRLPSRALGTAGGGPIPVDPMDPDGLRTLERVFQFDLELPPGQVRAAGERVFVRFDHGAEPVGQRGYRALRRVFLRQLGV